METFLISLLVFALAFAALAIGALRGRPLGPGGCGGCGGCGRSGEDGGMRCRR